MALILHEPFFPYSDFVFLRAEGECVPKAHLHNAEVEMLVTPAVVLKQRDLRRRRVEEFGDDLQENGRGIHVPLRWRWQLGGQHNQLLETGDRVDVKDIRGESAESVREQSAVLGIKQLAGRIFDRADEGRARRC